MHVTDDDVGVSTPAEHGEALEVEGQSIQTDAAAVQLEEAVSISGRYDGPHDEEAEEDQQFDRLLAELASKRIVAGLPSVG